MVKVEILCGIKHHGLQFHEGETRVMDEHTAGYFVGNGWAKYPGSDPAQIDTTPKTLAIETSNHGHQNPGVK